MRVVLVALSVCAVPALASAAVLEVGSGKTYSTIAAAAAAAQDGDTITLAPGTYTQGAVFTANNLTITAAPGSARGSVVLSTGTVGGKGLFQIKGDNAVIDGIRFRYAKVPDGNGAGIRAEGLNLTVRNSQFDRNEMGVLLTPRAAGSIDRIENSSFDINKSQRSGSLGHSVYATENVGSLTVTGSTFKRNYVGHYIKSRALETLVTGNTIDDTNGTASYLIEIPEGGAATITGNRLTKGASASNCCIAIAYGSEMYKGAYRQNPPGAVLIADNIFTNKRASSVAFVKNSSTPVNPVELARNTLIASAGSIRALSGTGTVNGVAQREPLLALADETLFSLSAGWDAASAEAVGAFVLSGPQPAAVPGPGGLALAGLGLTALAWRRRR